MKTLSSSCVMLVLLVCLTLSACATSENANRPGNTNATATQTASPAQGANANTPATTASPGDYNLLYEATTNTEWISNPSAPTPTKGSIKKGERIHFSREPSPIGATWQDAKLSDGTIRFVHPADFKKVS